jgi:6-pyruvoyltetrahydropterin/6-carboxytetrahydropterin synthase
MSFILQFERRFSMAHRLISGSSPKCAIPHGHNEFVKVHLMVTDSPTLDNSTNMIAAFAEAKAHWHQFVDERLDHSFQLRDDDPILSFFEEKEPHLLSRILVTPGDPTTEVLCACLMSKLSAFLSNGNTNLCCTRLELQETPTNTVILDGIDAFKAHLPQGNHWWSRPDLSINEFKTD